MVTELLLSSGAPGQEQVSQIIAIYFLGMIHEEWVIA